MPKMDRPWTIDYETIGIHDRPHYPPSPVGVSVKKWGCKSRYYSWGHIRGRNNSTFGEAREVLQKIYASKDTILFQNAKFDLAVGEVRMGLPRLPFHRVHDTLFLLYLNDPRQRTFQLKPSAANLLNWPAEEQDAVVEWLVANQPVPGVKITRGYGDNGAGAYIAHAPAELVGKYAAGDTDRTEALYKFLWPSIVERGMLPAYERERETLQVLLDMESHGVPVDHKRLDRDVNHYNDVQEQVTAWCVRRMGQAGNSDFNIDSDVQLRDALVDAGKVRIGDLLSTKKGNPSVSKESLAGAMADRQLLEMLAYRAELGTCLGTFMENWLHTADQSGGYIYTDWNQVRQNRGASNAIMGTSTGRLSSSPNFQNISNEFPPHFRHLGKAAGLKAIDLKRLPKAPFDLPALPRVRSYVVPYEGEVLIDRDYSQQELRILAHFEDGPLTQAYLDNPWLDIHQWARDEINAAINSDFERKPVKAIGFGLIYGMGLGLLAKNTATDVATARLLKKTYLAIAPGLKDLNKDMKRRAEAGEPIYTWGGREYYCEDPKLINGRWMEFAYKLLNVLVQGSAAECTKQAFINYYKLKPANHKLLLTVHDQLTSSIPKNELVEGMEIMRVAMEDVDFDVPMLSEGDYSFTDWAKSSFQKYDRGGELIYTGVAA